MAPLQIIKRSSIGRALLTNIISNTYSFYFQILIDYDIKFQEAKEPFYDLFSSKFVDMMAIFTTDPTDPTLKKIFLEFQVLRDTMSQGKQKTMPFAHHRST